MVRILAESEVKDLVDLKGAMAAFEKLFTQQAQGELVAFPPQHLMGGGANMQIRSGNLKGDERMGVRIATGTGNPAFALVMGLNGHPLAFIGYPFSETRLNASVGLGIDKLAKQGSVRVTILGAGVRALGLLEGACAVRKVESIQVYSPTAEHRTRFAPEAQAALGVPVRAVDDPEAAVKEADISIVMTNSKTPALLGQWLPDECLVVSAGTRTEVDENLYRRASLIVTTSREQELGGGQASNDWTLVRMTRNGELKPEDIVELGQVVIGNVPAGRGIRVYREPQGGFTDIALAALAYDRAIEMDRGIEISLD
jgi:alanine dehydrogenase